MRSPPEVVAAWYRDAGYDFLALTDHDRLTRPEPLRAAAGPMLLVPGEEVTSGPVHVNALGIDAPIEPRFGRDARETIELDVAAIRAQRAVPVLNHPNFRWAVGAAAIDAVSTAVASFRLVWIALPTSTAQPRISMKTVAPIANVMAIAPSSSRLNRLAVGFKRSAPNLCAIVSLLAGGH